MADQYHRDCVHGQNALRVDPARMMLKEDLDRALFPVEVWENDTDAQLVFVDGVWVEL